MAKRKHSQTKVEPASTKPAPKEPVSTHIGYQIALVVLVLGLIAQLAMAFIVYPQLASRIPSGWSGSAQPYNTVPKSVVFLLFPGFDLIVLAITLFAPKNAEGKRVMQTGNAISVIILAILFTVLQASAFFINRP